MWDKFELDGGGLLHFATRLESLFVLLDAKTLPGWSRNRPRTNNLQYSTCRCTLICSQFAVEQRKELDTRTHCTVTDWITMGIYTEAAIRSIFLLTLHAVVKYSVAYVHRGSTCTTQRVTRCEFFFFCNNPQMSRNKRKRRFLRGLSGYIKASSCNLLEKMSSDYSDTNLIAVVRWIWVSTQVLWHFKSGCGNLILQKFHVCWDLTDSQCKDCPTKSVSFDHGPFFSVSFSERKKLASFDHKTFNAYHCAQNPCKRQSLLVHFLTTLGRWSKEKARSVRQNEHRVPHDFHRWSGNTNTYRGKIRRLSHFCVVPWTKNANILDEFATKKDLIEQAGRITRHWRTDASCWKNTQKTTNFSHTFKTLFHKSTRDGFEHSSHTWNLMSSKMTDNTGNWIFQLSNTAWLAWHRSLKSLCNFQCCAEHVNKLTRPIDSYNSEFTLRI